METLRENYSNEIIPLIVYEPRVGLDEPCERSDDECRVGLNDGSCVRLDEPCMELGEESEISKYEILRDQYYDSGNRPRLYRIRAMQDIPNAGVKAGEFGGWVEDETCLSQNGFCWIGGSAMVYGGARVEDFAYVGGNSELNGRVVLRGNAYVDNSELFGQIEVRDRAKIVASSLRGKICVEGTAEIAYCPDFYGRDIVIGYAGTVCRQNHTIIGPIGEVGSVAFYLSDGNVVYSANNKVFDNMYALILELHDITRIQLRDLKQMMASVTYWLEA